MIIGDLSEWILDTHSQIIQLIKLVYSCALIWPNSLSQIQKDSIKVLAARNGYCSATKATTAELLVEKVFFGQISVIFVTRRLL